MRWNNGLRSFFRIKNAVILLYCRTGKRADKALETLRKMGYSHVENLHRFEM